MRVVLGTFARSGIEACFGGDIAEGVRTALRHYTQHGMSALDSVVLARLCRERPSVGSRHNLELTVEPEIEQALESRARAWGDLSVEELASHAVLVYLAEVDRADEPGTRPLVLL